MGLLIDRVVEKTTFENVLSDSKADVQQERGFPKSWTSSEDKMSEKKAEVSQPNPAVAQQSPKSSPPSTSARSESPKVEQDKQSPDYDLSQQHTDSFDKDLDEKPKSEDSQQQNPNSGGSIGSLLNFDLPDQIPSPIEAIEHGDSQNSMFQQLHDQTNYPSLDSPSKQYLTRHLARDSD